MRITRREKSPEKGTTRTRDPQPKHIRFRSRESPVNENGISRWFSRKPQSGENGQKPWVIKRGHEAEVADVSTMFALHEFTYRAGGRGGGST